MTPRYMWLKHPSPSPAGNASSSASIRAMASSTEVMGLSWDVDDTFILTSGPALTTVAARPPAPRPGRAAHQRAGFQHMARGSLSPLNAEQPTPTVIRRTASGWHPGISSPQLLQNGAAASSPATSQAAPTGGHTAAEPDGDEPRDGPSYLLLTEGWPFVDEA